jgi:hypothetical protein
MPTGGNTRAHFVRRRRPVLDHVHINERDFLAGTHDRFDVVERRWLRHYLGFVLVSRPAS